LLADVDGGTPQRLFFVLVGDPDIPDDPPPWPGPIGWVPFTLPSDSGQREITVDPNVAKEIRQRYLSRQRRQLIVAPLDSHADLARLKIAAILGFWDKRWSVTEEDWRLAGILMDYMVSVRTYLIEQDKAAAARKAKTATEVAAYRQVAVKRAVDLDDVDRFEQRVTQIATKVAEKPGITPRDLQRSIHNPGPMFHRALRDATQRGLVDNQEGHLFPPSVVK
jgi:hypothetical protein